MRESFLDGTKYLVPAVMQNIKVSLPCLCVVFLVNFSA